MRLDLQSSRADDNGVGDLVEQTPMPLTTPERAQFAFLADEAHGLHLHNSKGRGHSVGKQPCPRTNANIFVAPSITPRTRALTRHISPRAS